MPKLFTMLSQILFQLRNIFSPKYVPKGISRFIIFMAQNLWHVLFYFLLATCNTSAICFEPVLFLVFLLYIFNCRYLLLT